MSREKHNQQVNWENELALSYREFQRQCFSRQAWRPICQKAQLRRPPQLACLNQTHRLYAPFQSPPNSASQNVKRLEAQLEEALSASSAIPEVDVGGDAEEIVRTLVEGREARIVLISGL